jgi:peptidylprolyl isomerase
LAPEKGKDIKSDQPYLKTAWEKTRFQIVNMQQVKKGDTVKIHYHGKLTDGTTFDSSEGREPLEFEVGGGMVIPGFDAGVTGMSVGEKKTINIPAEEAYGDKQEEMIMEFPKDRFPDDMVPQVGMQLNMSNGQGQNFPVVIVDVKEDVVILDANHPLAGEELVFDLELVEISGSKPLIIMP